MTVVDNLAVWKRSTLLHHSLIHPRTWHNSVLETSRVVFAGDCMKNLTTLKVICTER